MDTAIVGVIEGGELAPMVYPAAERNPARVYLASLGSAKSRRSQARALNMIADVVRPGLDLDTFPWHTLRYQHTAAIRAQLVQRYNPTTINPALSALRRTLKAAWRLGYMTDEERAQACDIENVADVRPDQSAGRAVTPGELAAISSACNDGTAKGAQDAALFAVAYGGGLRRAEFPALDLEDYDAGTGQLTVTGKGNKTRTIYLENGQRDALEWWIHVRGNEPGALFVHIRKGDHVRGSRVTDQAIYAAMKARGEAAGVEGFTPHDFRRTYAGDLLDAGVDLATVQRTMGHASPETTAGYDRRGERAKQQAAGKIHFPYYGPRAK